jgi:hypothetical protein
MAINQLIAAGIQPPRFESPYNMMAQFAQIQQAQQANALNQMRMQQMERQMAQEEALGGMDYATLSQNPEAALRFGAPGRALYGEMLKGQRERRQAEQAQRDAELKSLGTLRFALADVSDQPSYDRWRGLVGQLAPSLKDAVKPEYDPEVVKRYQVEADKRLEAFSPKPTQMRLGDRVVTIDTNPNSPTYNKEISTRAMGVEPKSPEELARIGAETQRALAAADVSRAELAGTLPARPSAPSELTRLIAERDKLAPNDPNRAAYDARIAYLGAGSANTTAVIEDPTQPGRQIVVNPNVYAPGGGLGARGVLGTAAAQAPVSRAETAQDRARTDLDSSLDTLEGLYTELNKMRGLPSTERGTAANIGAYVASTPLGQVAGRAVGTKEQAIRDQIQSSRFVLIQQIKNATGMSAQQINSNAELKFALDSLADPQVGFEAATKIIENLRDQFVKGAAATRGRGMVGSEQTPTATPPQTVRLRGTTREELNAEVSKLPSGTIFIGPDGITRTKP